MIKDYCFPAFKNAFFNSFKKKCFFQVLQQACKKPKKQAKLRKTKKT